MTDVNTYFEQYKQLSEEVKRLKALEMSTRKAIIANEFTDVMNTEGTHKNIIGLWGIKAVFKKSYKFKKAAVFLSQAFDIRSYLDFSSDMHDFSNSGKAALEVASELQIPKELFKVGISVDLKKYRGLNDEQKKFIDQFIEIKPEAPTLTLEKGEQ